MHDLPPVAVNPRPEWSEAQFQLGNGDHVRPGPTVENGTDTGTVDAGHPGYLSNAAPADSVFQVENELSAKLSNRVIARRRRPVDRHLSWGDTRWARAHVESLAAAVGTFRAPTMSEVSALLRGCSYSQMSGEVSAVMAKYQPKQSNPEWQRIEAFVKDACSLAAPTTAYTASVLLSVSGAFVTWCVTEKGWPLQADVIFSRQAIDAYCTEANPKRGEGTRRNYRAILMRVSEVLAPEEHPQTMTPLTRKRVAEPYSQRHIDAFRRWALGQITPEKRRRAMLMLVFCAGAGLKSSDISTLFPDDITIDDAGVTIAVGGSTPRLVPLLAVWEEWILAILDQSRADQPLWGKPNRTIGDNLLSSFTQYTTGDRPRSDRLRATWIVTHLRAGVPVNELMRALGVSKFENLPRYLEFVQTADQGTYRKLLRGEVNA